MHPLLMTDRAREFCARLGLAHPIIQAPMAGGTTTPELVAAVCNEGALGSIGAAYLPPTQVGEAVEAVRARTNRGFCVNLFAGGYEEALRAVDAGPMLELVARHHEALGIAAPSAPPRGEDPFPLQIEAVVAARPRVFSFTFGMPHPSLIARLKSGGSFVMGTATTVEEARRLAAAGVDAVIAQGAEAGAQRGTFARPFEEAMIGTMALVPQIVDAIAPLAVVAAGGIMDGRGIVAALALGASAVQMGTAFLACDEAGTPEAYKARLASGNAEETAITRVFTGRPARGLVNRFWREAESLGPNTTLPFPRQNDLTRPMRAAAARAGDPERVALWCGQGVGLTRRMGAAALVRTLVDEISRATPKP
jgi:nitronate monooxygenase